MGIDNGTDSTRLLVTVAVGPGQVGGEIVSVVLDGRDPKSRFGERSDQPDGEGGLAGIFDAAHCEKHGMHKNSPLEPDEPDPVPLAQPAASGRDIDENVAAEHR